uniref:RdRp n=1 Tax=Erysiphe necator associated hypovirus 1 TaxID=2695355 RepID=A0A7U3MF17_9VIRU|nr:RdRp [Erysiphe necator associated hypovirus 1]
MDISFCTYASKGAHNWFILCRVVTSVGSICSRIAVLFRDIVSSLIENYHTYIKHGKRPPKGVCLGYRCWPAEVYRRVSFPSVSQETRVSGLVKHENCGSLSFAQPMGVSCVQSAPPNHNQSGTNSNVQLPTPLRVGRPGSLPSGPVSQPGRQSPVFGQTVGSGNRPISPVDLNRSVTATPTDKLRKVKTPPPQGGVRPPSPHGGLQDLSGFPVVPGQPTAIKRRPVQEGVTGHRRVISGTPGAQVAPYHLPALQTNLQATNLAGASVQPQLVTPGTDQRPLALRKPRTRKPDSVSSSRAQSPVDLETPRNPAPPSNSWKRGELIQGLCYLSLFVRSGRETVMASLGLYPQKRRVRKFAEANPHLVKDRSITVSAQIGFEKEGNMKPTMLHITPGGDVMVSAFLATDSYDSVPVGGSDPAGMPALQPDEGGDHPLSKIYTGKNSCIDYTKPNHVKYWDECVECGKAEYEKDVLYSMLVSCGYKQQWGAEVKTTQFKRVSLDYRGVQTSNLSDEKIEDLFHFLYTRDFQFRFDQHRWQGMYDGDGQVPEGSPTDRFDRCWMQLFASWPHLPMDVDHEFLRNRWLNQAQLRLVAANARCSTGSFDLVKSGPFAHVVKGSKTPAQVIEELGNELLGGMPGGEQGDDELARAGSSKTTPAESWGAMIADFSGGIPQALTLEGSRKERDLGAWVGDALLKLDCKHTAAGRLGVIADDKVNAICDNVRLTEYMASLNFKTEGFNPHTIGSWCEMLYRDNPSFREEFQAWFDLVPYGREVRRGKWGRCWTKLFTKPVVHKAEWIYEDALTKGQLKVLMLTHTLTTRTFSIIKEGKYWHLDVGTLTAQEVMEEMGVKTRLGMTTVECPLCTCKVDEQKINQHIDAGCSLYLLLEEEEEETEIECPMCEVMIPLARIESHIDGECPCSETNQDWVEPSDREVTPTTGLPTPETTPQQEKPAKVVCAGCIPSEIDVYYDSQEGLCWLEAQLFAGRWSHEQAGTLDKYKAGLKYWRSQELDESMRRPKAHWEITMQLDPVTMPFFWGWEKTGEGKYHVSPNLPVVPTVDFIAAFDPMDEIGLTTAVVMGTIGDVEPTLDVVATNFFAAEMEKVPEVRPVEEQYKFVEGEGHGWMASDFFRICDGFAKHLSDTVGSAKGDLEVSPELWNLICAAWDGEPLCGTIDPDETKMPGSFVVELSDEPGEWLKVPPRPIGSHKRVMPSDFVLVTHPDHIEKFRGEGWETVALPMSSKDFIALGQSILEKGLFAVQDMKAMHNTLFDHIKAAMPVCEQSDLIYLVSGTTFHYFLGSVFPDKQVFEVCPVPREDNGVCPEFYLGHYFKDFSVNPHFGFQVGRLYNKFLTAPKYLTQLEWEGEFKYREPPKFHSIMPWAANKWQISSPSIGFKPYNDFVRKTVFNENRRIRAYFSLGSCESITKETQKVLEWLRKFPITWTVDSRWSYLFEGTTFHIAPFRDHATWLHEFDWVVHHGGSGVTNTCCAIGVPHTIVPQIGDQFIWYEALKKQQVPLYCSERDLRAWLYRWRLPAKEQKDWAPEILDGPGEWQLALNDNGATPVEPFAYFNHCCHDTSEYGYKPTDLVIGQNEAYWFTLFNCSWEKKGSEVDLTLKFVRKICSPTGPPVVGWSGFPLTQTYPGHAHGWAMSNTKLSEPGALKAFNGEYLAVNSEETMRAFGQKALTSRALDNPFIKMNPRNVECSCGNKGYDFNGQCEKCALSRYKGGKIPLEDLESLRQTVYRGFKPRRKISKKATFAMAPSTFWVQSRKRYYQVDSRVIPSTECPPVARALMDQIQDMTDVRNLEAFWDYTKTKPPHYDWNTTQYARDHLIKVQKDRYVSLGLAGLGADVVTALGGVLSVGSFRALYERLGAVNLFTSKGRDFMRKRWWVLVDAMRHFDDFTKSLGIEAMPGFLRKTFLEIPHATVRAVIPFKLALAKPIRTRAAGFLWLDQMRGQVSTIRIHLFSLKLPALGTAFGVFHAVVEHEGWYWELQQVSGEKCHINRTRYPPEPSSDRPLVKTILINSPVKGSLDHKRIHTEFNGIGYKVLGDNCLVFANMLVFLLTGRVVPWRHFGAFGKDYSLDMQKELGQWAASWVFLGEDEERLQVRDNKHAAMFWKGDVVSSLRTWTGPKRVTRDYGLVCVQRVEAALEAYSDDPDVECPQEKDHMVDFMKFAIAKFGISGAILSRAILTRRTRRIPTSTRKWRFLHHLLVLLRQAKDIRIVQDAKGVLTATANLRGALREGKKVGWTPILNISVPRHWFRSQGRLVEVNHLPENLTMQKKTRVCLDLPQIRKKYMNFFEGVEFPEMGFKWVRPGEYEIGVKVPLRKDLPRMDELTASLCQELQDMHPYEVGVFSLRFGTLEMAEKVTDRYFSGSFEAGQLISEADQEEVAQAIFDNEKHLYSDTQLISPEEVWKKWHRNYSAGFPFRFSSRGNQSRQKLVDMVGGKEKFLECVRNYIQSPEAYPTVSHAFIKDEVLPKSYIEREKIRTVIAQDPLNYYLAMAVQGDASKRLDPTSFSAVGVSASHGEMAALAGQHLAYRHHTAMDVTAMDSTASVDAVGVIKKLRKKGFANHSQREAIESAIDCTYDNLVASWIIDIHSGRARLKKQGLSTGHATTTPSNSEYMRVLMLYAWKEITGRPYSEFYDCVKFSTFSDDNFWSTDLEPDVFSGALVSEFWLRRGVQVRVEGCSDNLADLSFLSKKFSLDAEHLAEVETLTGARPKVAIVHDIGRLLTKFSDYKKKNTLRYRWEKIAALQLNLAHYPEVHAKVDEYLDVLEKQLLKRQSGRTFLRQHPRKSYADVMALTYLPNAHTKKGLIVSTHEVNLWDKLTDWWDTTRADIMTFDSTANTYGRVLSQIAGLLEIGGLNIEDPGLFMKGPGEYHHDDEYTLEHHLYLLNGCPESFEKMSILASKTPFSIFMDIPGFWARREQYDMSEEMANGLRLKVSLLLGIYTIVAWLEQMLYAVPILGPLYKLVATAKYMSEKLYSRLNSIYYATFGDSSAVISAMMPKDRFLNLKVIAHRLWCGITPLDCFNIPGGVDNAQEWVDSMIKFGQDLHQIVLDFDMSPFLPVPGSGERSKQGTTTGWTAIDHRDSVLTAKAVLAAERTPMITGVPGAGKSTDFILSLKQEYETVIVACPRQILVTNNPIAQTKLYSGCQDHLTTGYVNFGTAGYLRRTLSDLPESTIICLDEFHELDEDTLWLLDRYRGQCMVITATPEFYGAERFREVRLTKGRNASWNITDDLRQTNGRLEDGWETLMGYAKTQDRVLFIVTSVRDVETCLRHAQQLTPNKRVCGLYRGHNTVIDADWYFATSIVDAGLTIPGVTVVIDSGWSLGWKNGKFIRRASSRNISAQRRGRTGRTCHGTYIRMIATYDDTNWDFSTPFMCNSWSTAVKWDPTFRRGVERATGVIESLPGGYEEIFGANDWSMILYTVFMYESRLDVNKARTSYQAMRKFPESKNWAHLTSRIENHHFDDLCLVEDKLSRFRLTGQSGNFWNWNLSSAVLIDFEQAIPSHLLDVD